MEKHPIVAFAVLDNAYHVVTDSTLLNEIDIQKIIDTHIKVDYVNYSTSSYDEKESDLTADYIHHMYIVHINKESQSEQLLPNTLRLDYPYLEEQWYVKEIESNKQYRLAKYTLYLYHK